VALERTPRGYAENGIISECEDGKTGTFVQSVLGEEESMVIRNISLFSSLGRIWWKR